MHRLLLEETILIFGVERWRALAKGKSGKVLLMVLWIGFIDRLNVERVMKDLFCLLKPRHKVQGRKWQKTILENRIIDDYVGVWKSSHGHGGAKPNARKRRGLRERSHHKGLRRCDSRLGQVSRARSMSLSCATAKRKSGITFRALNDSQTFATPQTLVTLAIYFFFFFNWGITKIVSSEHSDSIFVDITKWTLK